MPDPIFADPRLAAIYDAFEGDRADLELYAGLVASHGARRVLDVGCGTGTFACLLARRGIDVIGVDPAAASVDVARGKPGADRVRWIVGEAANVPADSADMATMTGNVAQVFLTDDEWAATLGAVHRALRPNGVLVFETRDPAQQAWRAWNRDRTVRRLEVPGLGEIASWCEVTRVAEPYVAFRWTYESADGAVIISDSTLRFRTPDEIQRSLADAGYPIVELLDAPDRPGREFVFVARRSTFGR